MSTVQTLFATPLPDRSAYMKTDTWNLSSPSPHPTFSDPSSKPFNTMLSKHPSMISFQKAQIQKTFLDNLNGMFPYLARDGYGDCRHKITTNRTNDTFKHLCGAVEELRMINDQTTMSWNSCKPISDHLIGLDPSMP